MTTLKILATGITLLVFLSCKKTEKLPVPAPIYSCTDSSTYKIMPLGASRVVGNRPNFESFRYELWKYLSESGCSFDFIGTQIDDTSYPSFNGKYFDRDHEGRSGWVSEQILNELNVWLNETGAPDIVLFSSPGGNDGLQNLAYKQTISNINAIIDELQSVNPKVTILIEQMAPGHSNIMTTELTSYFEQLNQDITTISNEQSTDSSKVIAIDMYSGFTDSMLADGVHYNKEGANFIATRYYNALINALDE